MLYPKSTLHLTGLKVGACFQLALEWSEDSVLRYSLGESLLYCLMAHLSCRRAGAVRGFTVGWPSDTYPIGRGF